MSGFVVCRSCGTRIKAGRAFCLKCFEPLPAPGAPAPTTLWVSLGLSDGQQVFLAVGVALAVVALVAVIWETQPVPLDDRARPATGQAGVSSPATGPAVSTPTTPPAALDSGPGVPAFEPAAAAPVVRTELASTDVASLERRRAAYEQELVQRPDDADALNRLGQVLAGLGRFEEAAARFERAVAIAPDRRTYHFNLARAAAALGQPDRAIAEYREVVRLQPQDYAAQFTLGTALQANGDDLAAAAELEKAVALDPKDPSAHLRLGVSLERAGRVAEAVREYRRFIAIQPGSAEAGRLTDHLATLSTARP